MGLKHFHLFFIACALALMAVVMRWAALQADYAIGAWAGLGALAGFAYLAWFVRHYKTLG